MPTTQAIRDGQEAYYLTNSKYADEIAKLDVKTTSTDDMSIDVGDEEETPELSYVIASRPNINNNLIMYQKHSEKFADNVHCEALKDNSQAQWLCETALHGEYIPGGIHEDYDTYLLSGTLRDNDYFAKECEGSGEQACECGVIVGRCDDKDGQWVYEGTCPDKPAATQSCTTGMGTETRNVTCDTKSGAWQTSTWSTAKCYNVDTALYNRYQQLYSIAQDLAAQMESYYKTYGRYPAKTWRDYGNLGTCYYPDNTVNSVPAVYCSVSTPKVANTSKGAIGIVLQHTGTSEAGKSFCRAYVSQMQQLCGALTGEDSLNTPHYY